MSNITLQDLLEAGCHFGHKSERWHPKAESFIYTEKDGIHVIDLAKTKSGLEAAVEFVIRVVSGGGEVIFVGTKRQARGVVKEAAGSAGAPYFVERWIGGFMTNWDSIKKNIEKINRLTSEQANNGWKHLPKHEQTALGKYLGRLNVYYSGVLNLKKIPEAIFVVDIKKEDAAVREARRCGVPVIAIVDTNADPTSIDYVIPANDDAVGSIQYITQVVAQAYKDGKDLWAKSEAQKQQQAVSPTGQPDAAPVAPVTPEPDKAPAAPEQAKKFRGRPKKK